MQFPCLDTVIDQANQLGKDEPKQFVFTDHSGRIIGNIELPGVDMGNETPQKLDDNDVDNVENTNIKDTLNEDTQEEPTPHEEPNYVEP
jgi:hypothetical protein